MRNIIKLTNDFILDSGIHTLPLKIDDLSNICKALGYRLMSYQEAMPIIRKLGVERYTDYPAFTLAVGKGRLVLFDSTQSTSTRLFAIAHEIGHIVLKHNYQGVVGFTQADSAQEYEANAFAYQLLAPLCVLKSRNIFDIEDIESQTLLDTQRAKAIHKSLHNYHEQPRADELIKAYKPRQSKKRIYIPVILGVLAALLLAVSIFLRITPDTQEPTETTTSVIDSLRGKLQRATETAYAEKTEIPSTTISPNESETVYITAHGERYHKQNCYHIKNSTTISDVPLSEAVEQGYTACKTCYK